MRNSTSKIRSIAVRIILAAGVALLAFNVVEAQEAEAREIESSLGVSVTNQYFFRGIQQETEGLIVQPWIDFVFPLREGENASWSLNIGTWNSLHDGPTGSGGSGMTMHYELDAYAGVGVDFAENWSSSLSYVILSSPNSAFNTVEELNFSFSFDDSGRFGKGARSFSGFQPHVLVALEVSGQSDGGSGEGIYLELGIEPALGLNDDGKHPVSLSFPVVAGLSVDDYYEDAMGSDDAFGFAQGGVAFSTVLNPASTQGGSWTLSGGAHVLLLGDNLKAINGGSGTEVIVSLDIGFAF